MHQPLTIAALLMATFAGTAGAATTSDRCEAAKVALLGDYARCHLGAAAKGLRRGLPPDGARCFPKLLAKLEATERRYTHACPVRGESAALDALVRAAVAHIIDRIAPQPLGAPARACAADKLLHAGNLAECRAKVEGAALAGGTIADVSGCERKARTTFGRAEGRFGAACPTRADADLTSAELGRLTASLRLNVVVVYLDDVRSDFLDHLPDGMTPHLERLANEGVVFRNAFAPTPMCAQARASLLTGLRIQGGVRGGHGVRTLSGIGNFDDGSTLATWLTAEGRGSGLFGKYINGYTPPAFDLGGGRMYVPPGWTEWFAVRSNEFYGGLLGATWYAVTHDGTQIMQPGCCSRSAPNPSLCRLADPACLDDQTYQTDVLAAELLRFVEAAPASGWLAVLSPSAAHGGHAIYADPAARHLNTFLGIAPWRPPSHGVPILNPPTPLNTGFSGTPLPIYLQPGFTDGQRQFGLETLLAVDEAVGELFDTLAASGQLARTAIILSSDNGITWGEHGLWNQSKGCAYEECQRVPMIIRMPDGIGRTVDEPVLVTDLAPTIAALARVPVPAATDGRSFEPVLRGAPMPASWRTDYCLEYDSWVPHWVGYRGVRDLAGGFTYVQYSNGGVELFDLHLDPAQLQNVAGLPAYAADQSRLAERMGELCS